MDQLGLIWQVALGEFNLVDVQQIIQFFPKTPFAMMLLLILNICSDSSYLSAAYRKRSVALLPSKLLHVWEFLFHPPACVVIQQSNPVKERRIVDR